MLQKEKSADGRKKPPPSTSHTHTHAHLHHCRTPPGSQVRLVDKGRRRLAYDNLASRPPLIIHLIIQSETLGTRLRILHGSSLSASLTLSLLSPPPPPARSPPSFSNPPLPSQRRQRWTDERTPLYLFGSAPLLVQVETNLCCADGGAAEWTLRLSPSLSLSPLPSRGGLFSPRGRAL